jgi:hypothetical protein
MDVIIHVSYLMLAYWCTDVVQSVSLANGLPRATATHALVLYFLRLYLVYVWGENGTGLFIYMYRVFCSFSM